ncbi:MAG: hypothetical protein HY236_14170 [Acidobacteria bacterium]|nr:hypothetical protein [Acidobacteriota bacterium]
MGDGKPTVYEQALLDGLRARVDKVTPQQLSGNDAPHASEALGVEAIFAALFLAENPGDATPPAEAQKALDRMWALQLREGPGRGAWAWNSYDLDPWEMPESTFYGAALAALATGIAPPEYRNRPDVRERIAELIAYLQRDSPKQPLHNRLALLWASTRLPDVLSASMRRVIIDEVWQRQQPDGGWNLESLGPWKKRAQASPSPGSNSYGTAFTAFVLQTAGVVRSDSRLIRALDWLKSHQDHQFGYWAAESMNKRYETGSMPSLFMRDAATAFATFALLAAGEPGQSDYVKW